MKFYVLSENLQNKLTFASHAVSIRSQLPVLLNFLLETKKGKLFIKSTDLEIGIETEIPANIEEEGGVTVPAKIFLELVNSFPAEKIFIQTKNTAIEVISKNTKSTIQTISKEEFPKLYEEKGQKIAEMKKANIKKDLMPVVFAASQDTTRPGMSGVLIKKEGKKFILVATDGYRLSLKETAQDIKSKDDKKNSLLVPARVIREVISSKEKEGIIEVFMSSKNNQVLFCDEEVTVVGRLLDADFPSYEKIIPASYTTRALFQREEMQNAVRQCIIFSREGGSVVRLSLKKDKIIIHAQTPNIGENRVEIEAKISGDENEIAFNARYLIDLFASLEENEMVFEMMGPLNPGVFKIEGDPTFLHLIMPIRVQSDSS